MKPNRILGVKLERNNSLVEDYKNGMPLKEIRAKYKISKARVYQIIHRA